MLTGSKNHNRNLSHFLAGAQNDYGSSAEYMIGAKNKGIN